MEVEKGQPPLRIWELNENSTRYDNLVAAPSDEELTIYWMAWGGVTSFVGLSTLIVFLGVLSSKKARRNSFNVYLLYLMVPDFMFSLLCGITCILNASKGAYWSAWMCNFQQWYCVFGIGANAWLNAVICQQLHTMLRFSNRRRRYKSPSRWQVTKQALAVYAYCAFLGGWGLIDSDHFPYHTGLPSGLACLPIERDVQSTIFFWIIFFPLFVGIPVVFVIYVCYDVWFRSKLLPPTGQRRTLVVYFFRLILVFVIMWLPTFIMLFVAASWLPPWAHFAGGTWSHLQGTASAGVSLLKPDIWTAVYRFVTCQWWSGDAPETTSGLRRGPRSSTTTIAWGISGSLRVESQLQPHGISGFLDKSRNSSLGASLGALSLDKSSSLHSNLEGSCSSIKEKLDPIEMEDIDEANESVFVTTSNDCELGSQDDTGASSPALQEESSEEELSVT